MDGRNIEESELVIKNYTSHDIHIIKLDDHVWQEGRKWVADSGVSVARTVLKGKVLNADFEMLESDIDGIKVIDKRVISIDEIPEDCDVAIVSAMYAAASNDERIFTIMNKVFSEDGRILGCLAIGRLLRD